MIKHQHTSSRWCERSELTRTGSRKRAKLCFAHCGSPLLLFTSLIAGMTTSGETFAEEAKEDIVVCQIVTKHTPQSDVAYRAGVDVYGNAVVPADLNATPFQVPNVIKVPLDINLAERMNILVEGLQLEAPLGMLEIHQDGRVVYNDQDWTAPVMTLCGQSHKVIEEVAVTQTPAQEIVEDGQALEDVIKSPVEVQAVTEVEDVIEVQPTEAIPPKEVHIGQIEVDPPVEEDVIEESDVIEGGEYREIYYNE